MSYERELEAAKLVAQEAGALALDYQRRGVTAESKSDDSPVTAADRACEKLIVETISGKFPDDGILGEEGACRESRNGRKWIIDPIDGTRDFVRGIPLWAVLIGLEEHGKIVAGAAHCPGQNYLLYAARGSGAFANGSPIRVSTKTEASQAVLSFNGFNKLGVRPFSPSLLRWIEQFWAVRSLGGAMDAMLLAQGMADVWIEPNAAPWDLAPLKILIEEAGGVFKSLVGEDTIYGGNAYACTPALEPAVKALLRPSVR
ncbi:MAG TPA: inositol monophosphatase [Bryobacteraceae bacterium]|jgi:histidinol phosphatase-like enzyme (inositol monophosphatase family)|nr:inositol monophosphatase [Bryobacteraceae bacterium]